MHGLSTMLTAVKTVVCLLLCSQLCPCIACRDRMSEVLSYLERNVQDLDALAANVEEAAEEAAEA